MADRIQLRRDTAANWTAYNPILLEGEPGIEIDTDQWKLGDGVHTWSQLAYRGGECVQQRGQSTTVAMSQKAVTDELNLIGVFDISAHNLTDGQPTKYADLTAALGTNGANVPTQYRVPGMTIRYVQSSDNKYVQYRLMADEFTTDIIQWAIADEGVYVENPEFVYVKTDAEGKILWAIKTDGDIYYGAGVPQQIVDSVNSIKTELLDIVATKVSKEEGKGLIPLQYIEDTDNLEFTQVMLDNKGKTIEGIKKDGTKEVFGNIRVHGKINGVDIEKTSETVNEIEEFAENQSVEFEPDYLNLEVDEANRILGGRKTDGTKFENVAYEVGGSEFKGVKSHEFISAVTDKLGRIIKGVLPDGTEYSNTDPSSSIIPGKGFIIDGNVVEENILVPLSFVDVDNRVARSLSNLSKKGFVVMRTDDNTIIPEIPAIAEYFGYRYSMCINIINAYINNQIDFYRQLQQRGHEMCDHTPNNTTYYCDILPEWNSLFASYIGNGIRKIQNSPTKEGWKRVFFDFESIRPYSEYSYGNANAYHVSSGSNRIYGDFSASGIEDMNINNIEMSCVYVYIGAANGSVTKGWHVATKPDGVTDYLQIVDGENNPINFGTDDDISICLAVNNIYGYGINITFTESSQYLIVLCGQLWWPIFGFNKPKTWACCGGSHPLSVEDRLHKAIKKLGMNDGEIGYGFTALTYGYVDNTKNYLACAAWNNNVLHLDEASESTLAAAKLKIAESVALKQIVTIGSHYRWTDFAGSRKAFVEFVYELFKFIYDNNLELVTLTQRKHLLIDSRCDEYANVMPDLYTDMTNRGYPDGYSTDNVITTLLQTGGKYESKGRALQLNGSVSNGKVLQVIGLGGISRGTNILKFDYKGNCGTLTIKIDGKVRITSGVTTQIISETVVANSIDWDTAYVEFDYPTDYNFIDILITSEGYSEGAIISNLVLTKN